MNRVELKMAAKEQIKGNIGTLFLCYLVLSLLTGAANFAYVGFLISAPLTVGIMLNYLKMSRGEKPTVKGIFDPFNYYGKTLGLTLLISLFVTLWSLLLIVPGIIKAISYS